MIYISYFWNVRNFNPNCIPISSALSDPKWYHDNRGKDYQYIDKNGVYCGLRCEMLVPGPQLSGYCGASCKGTGNKNCPFLLGYREQLNKINFNDFIERTEILCEKVGNFLGVIDPVPVFLVHEAPGNPCSERFPLFDWFAENGVQVEEYPVPVKKSSKPKRQMIFDF